MEINVMPSIQKSCLKKQEVTRRTDSLHTKPYENDTVSFKGERLDAALWWTGLITYLFTVLNCLATKDTPTKVPYNEIQNNTSSISSDTEATDTNQLQVDGEKYKMYIGSLWDELTDSKNIIDGEYRSEEKGSANKYVNATGYSAEEIAWDAGYTLKLYQDANIKPSKWFGDICQMAKEGTIDCLYSSIIKQAAEDNNALIPGDKALVGDLCFLNENKMGIVCKIEQDGTILVISGDTNDKTLIYPVQPQNYYKVAFADVLGINRENIDNLQNAIYGKNTQTNIFEKTPQNISYIQEYNPYNNDTEDRLYLPNGDFYEFIAEE